MIAAAFAVTLVVGVVLVLAARHTGRSTPPASSGAAAAQPGTSTSTSSTTSGLEATTSTTGIPSGAGSGSRSGARGTGPFANGTPASLDVATGTPLNPLPPPEAGWRPLSVMQGTGNGSSATFHISSRTTQVRFRTSAGQFHIFVVDQAQGRGATAGYADVDCSRPCGDLQELSVPAGDYHVEVDADGPWELSLEEYHTP